MDYKKIVLDTRYAFFAQNNRMSSLSFVFCGRERERKSQINIIAITQNKLLFHSLEQH